MIDLYVPSSLVALSSCFASSIFEGCAYRRQIKNECGVSVH